MSVKYALAMTIAGSVAVLAVTPTFAASALRQSFFAAENAGYLCANAAAAAESKGTATERDVAACTAAINLTRKDMKNGYVEALTNRGVLHLTRAEYAAAIVDSDTALKVDSKIPEAMVNRGIAHMQQRQAKDAVTDFSNALALSPAHAEKAYFNRAMAREDMGDLLGAYLDYRQAAQMNPTWTKPKEELARFTVVQRAPTS